MEREWWPGRTQLLSCGFEADFIFPLHASCGQVLIITDHQTVQHKLRLRSVQTAELSQPLLSVKFRGRSGQTARNIL